MRSTSIPPGCPSPDVKVTEDVYPAGVHSSALARFCVRFWAGSIDHKLSLIRDAYTALYDESMATRAEWLQATTLFPIIFEIVMTFIFN